ncbi:hypothetical protein [Aquimarina algicola]|uniref:Uncharacterized protein n=1 Tax=Aquimarina algicola TaxID=2589995 RepID=A0A504JN15_9FLAO|nr:hypothetical protein [Aquimarina algicola]TPN89083.1 hypothetical protein FHK87_02355 [Aquimarina algicola]
MKIKSKYYIYILIIILFNSCNSQSRMDLAELTLSEDFLTLIPKNERSLFYPDKINPDTGTPAFNTNEVQKYKYKNILFDQPEVGTSQVTFYTYKALEKGGNNQIAGIHFNIEGKNDELFTILKKQYGNPKELSPTPTTPKEGVLYGYNSFIWKENKISIFLGFNYSGLNDKQRIQTTVHILKNDVIDLTSPKRTSVERLTQTLTKK